APGQNDRNALLFLPHHRFPMAKTVCAPSWRVNAVSLSNEVGNTAHTRAHALRCISEVYHGILSAYALLMSFTRESASMAPPSDKALLQELRTVRDDLTQLVDWWRARQAFFDRSQDPMWETELKTYHVARPYIDMIKRQADLECTTITEIVNRAFQQF